MSKPEWKEAPEWAQWLAQDSDCKWWWFDKEPENAITLWYPTGAREARADGGDPIGPKEPRPKPKPKREPEEWFLVAGESLGVPSGTIAVISTTTSATGKPCARVRFERYTP